MKKLLLVCLVLVITLLPLSVLAATATPAPTADAWLQQPAVQDMAQMVKVAAIVVVAIIVVIGPVSLIINAIGKNKRR